ncbi:hypothetical protein OHA21_21460 [Actinoplanes sp. NBC_00393]|uniref:hypothetical protein n=1 Tax=Actinoplanes sp. NBC_00393 TaxID=2975953 RepID=UPI002E22A377
MDAFERDGFVKIEQAVPAEIVDECVRLLWSEIDAEPDDPATWRQPVYWVGDMAQPPLYPTEEYMLAPLADRR